MLCVAKGKRDSVGARMFMDYKVVVVGELALMTTFKVLIQY